MIELNEQQREILLFTLKYELENKERNYWSDTYCAVIEQIISKLEKENEEHL